MEASPEINTMKSAILGTDDREAHSKFWIAVYTRPRSEKKTALELGKLGIETYVPIQKQLRVWSDRRKYVEIPVIPMILFAYIIDNDIQIVKAQSQIIRIISHPGNKAPAHIPSGQIETLKYILGQSEIPVSFEPISFRSNDTVTITRGSLIGLRGQVKAITENMTTVWLSIDLLGGAVLKIQSSDLEHTKLPN
jgi:transcription antitermination factor NusG